MDVKTHYDLLVEENNDPFRDPPALRKHMESWDGQVFLDLMNWTHPRQSLRLALEQEGSQGRQPGAVII